MRLRDLENTRLGKFSTTGRLIATDPCYGRVDKTDRLQMVIDVLPGTYIARASLCPAGRHERVAELFILHDLYRREPVWERAHRGCGVDSGQFGFYDLEKYPLKENIGEYGDLKTFYGRACQATDDLKVLEEGAGTQSGYGDGSYPVFLARNHEGDVIGLRVVFIGAEDDEDMDFDEDEEFDDGPGEEGA